MEKMSLLIEMERLMGFCGGKAKVQVWTCSSLRSPPGNLKFRKFEIIAFESNHIFCQAIDYSEYTVNKINAGVLMQSFPNYAFNHDFWGCSILREKSSIVNKLETYYVSLWFAYGRSSATVRLTQISPF